MNRACFIGLILMACLIACYGQRGHGQPPAGRKGALGELGARVGDQRASRQAEVIRLDKRIDQLQSRVQQLERQIVVLSQAPIPDVAESEAALALAEARLAADERALSKGLIEELQVAADRYDVLRARKQLDLARAAYQDRTLTLEMDLTYAEGRLAEVNQRREYLERMVAKGYTSSDALKLQTNETEIARKQLEQAHKRLQLHKKQGRGETTD